MMYVNKSLLAPCQHPSSLGYVTGYMEVISTLPHLICVGETKDFRKY